MVSGFAYSALLTFHVHAYSPHVVLSMLHKLCFALRWLHMGMWGEVGWFSINCVCHASKHICFASTITKNMARDQHGTHRTNSVD